MTAAAARLRALLPLWPALLVIAVWLPSLPASFQFDDWAVIVADPRVQSLAAWWQAMPGIRPLLKLSYALNHTLGHAPWGFRLVNLLLHALNASLVFILLRRLARRLRVADAGGAALIAATAAVVFALHPVQSESVTYVSGRSNVLMATAVLLSLLAFSHRSADRRLPWMQVLAVLAVVAALAAKETAAVTPLAMALLLPLDQRRNIGAALLAILPALLMVALLLALGLILLPYAGLLATSLATRGPLDNLLAQTQGIGWLLGQLLGLEPLNADPALQPLTVWTSQAALTALGLVLLLLLAVWNLRARPGVAFGVLWFFLWLAPTNSLLARLDLANDRQLYLAIIGPGWLLGLALCRLEAWLRESLPAAALVLLAALAMTLSTATLLRNRVYDTEVDFWQDVALQSPHNARAANNLGMAHALACQPLAARAAFERATALAPQDPRAAVNLALLAQGELPGQPTEPACRFSPLP